MADADVFVMPGAEPAAAASELRAPSHAPVTTPAVYGNMASEMKELESAEVYAAELATAQADESSAYGSNVTFEELDLPSALLEGVKLMGFNKPSGIQASTLPAICRPLQGGGYTNVIAQAKAGSGKTAAFALSMLSRVDLTREVTQCVCLSNTRELAIQVGAGKGKERGEGRERRGGRWAT